MANSASSRKRARRRFLCGCAYRTEIAESDVYAQLPDVAALEAGWDKFLADPDWKKLSSDPQFRLDPPTVSNVNSIVLSPLACSQV